MAKKKTVVNELFQYEDLSNFFIFVKKNVNIVRKKLGKFEEPYSEISQNYKNIMLKVVLPDITKNNLQLKMSENLVEIKAEQKKTKGKAGKTFYRTIDLPSNANTKKATAQYKKNKLKIVIPKVYS